MLYENFVNVPKEYSVAPFWFWNDDLKPEHLKWQMKEMYDKGVYEVVISSRRGIEIDYLSDEWFDRIEVVVDYAAELGMKIWLYDEDNWPSGYAGGKVLEENPDYCGKHVKRLEVLVENDAWKETIKLPVIGAFLDGEQVDLEKTEIPVGSKLIVFCQDYTLWNPAYTDSYYTDMLSRKATECFIKYTHQIYKDRVSKYFGNVIKGFFVDEPGFYNNLQLIEIGDTGTAAWTDEFPQYFLSKNGYDIVEKLPHLWEVIDESSAKIRIDYYETLCDMYKENYLDVLRKFCEDNQMILIGHLHYEEFMHYQIATQGNFMRALESLSIVGLDRIDTNTEKIAEKYASSAAHACGSPRVLSETYALSGWELTLQEMKRWVDYQYVRGVNMLVPHAFYCSIEGDRNTECPPSEFYQNPYWKYFKYYSDYTNRASYIFSQGKHRCHIALYYPINSMQAVYEPMHREKVIEADKDFQKLAIGLSEYQLDYDIITKNHLLDAALLENGRLEIGEEDFGTLVISVGDYFDQAEVDKIDQFIAYGGKVIFANGLPKQFAHLETHPNVLIIKERLANKSYTFAREVLTIQTFMMQNDQVDLYLPKHDPAIKYMHRIIEGKDFYFITNEVNQPKKVSVYMDGVHGVEKWNLENGQIQPVCSGVKKFPVMYMGATRIGREHVAEISKTFTECVLELDSYESVLLCLNECEQISKEVCEETFLPICGQWNVKVGNKEYVSESPCLEDLGEYYFSGTYTAETIIQIPEGIALDRVELIAEDVKDILELQINGVSAGTKIFAPYKFDITKYVKHGENKVTAVITNTLLNELRQMPKMSGIYGKLGILISKTAK